MIVKLISELKNKNPEIASGPSNNSLLIEIRDLLKKV
jgi:large-conductance mechanosensitive channel